ncbi:DUF697 domain-containing protein [Candidatus Dependentiae bacterium]|nr:DUF697 domain-containing protein [Candidatus Dependentiae bacterium]
MENMENFSKKKVSRKRRRLYEPISEQEISEISINDKIQSEITSQHPDNIESVSVKEISEEYIPDSSKIEKARQIIKKYSCFSIAAGVIPVPLVDIAALTAVQLKMIAELTNLYRFDFSEEKGKAILSSITSSIISGSLGNSGLKTLLKMIPGIGTISSFLFMPGIASAATYYIGQFYLQHYESGGTFLDFDPSKVKKYFENKYNKKK